MTIDEPTLATILGLVSLAAGAMFFALGALARQIAGVRYWAVGCLAVGFATVLDGPRLIDDWRWASLFFNIPFGIGHAYMLTGTLDFCRHSHSRLLLPVAAAVVTVLTVAFTFVYPHTAWRIGTLCATRRCSTWARPGSCSAIRTHFRARSSMSPAPWPCCRD